MERMAGFVFSVPFRTPLGNAVGAGHWTARHPVAGCFPTHPVGEGLAPPAGFWKAFILRGGFRPAEVNRRAGQETRPYKAISVMRDTATAVALKPRLSLWNQTGS